MRGTSGVNPDAVASANQPIIEKFSIDPPSIVAGQTTDAFLERKSVIDAGEPATLQWNVSGATSIVIDNNSGSSLLSWTIPGDVPSISIDQRIGRPSSTYSQTVTPTKRTTYTLTVTNTIGSNSASVMVDVQQDKCILASQQQGQHYLVSEYKLLPYVLNILSNTKMSLEEGANQASSEICWKKVKSTKTRSFMLQFEFSCRVV